MDAKVQVSLMIISRFHAMVKDRYNASHSGFKIESRTLLQTTYKKGHIIFKPSRYDQSTSGKCLHTKKTINALFKATGTYRSLHFSEKISFTHA